MKHSVSCLIILGVRISDETLLLVFDILVLGVWISDETLLLVFDILLLKLINNSLRKYKGN